MSDTPDPFTAALQLALRELEATVGTAIAYLSEDQNLAAIGTLAGTFDEQAANVQAAMQLIRSQKRRS